MPGNLLRGQQFAAVIKSGSIKTRLAMYDISQLENEALVDNSIEPELVEWDAKQYEVTHVNYIHMNGKCYFFFGYVGGFEILSEKCDKKHFKMVSADSGKFEHKLMETAFTSSCVGYRRVDGTVQEVLMVGTSVGEIMPISITVNNTVMPKPERKLNLQDENSVVTAMQSDARLPNRLVVGTCQGQFYFFDWTDAANDVLK